MARSSHSRTLSIVVALVIATSVCLLPAAAWANTLKLVQTIRTEDTPRSVNTGDINGDGRMDVVVGNFNSGTISIYYQLPGGGFPTTASVTLTSTFMANPSSVAIGDVDGDAQHTPDIVVADAGNALVYVFRQQPFGTFLPITKNEIWPLRNAPHWIGMTDAGKQIGFHPWGAGYQVEVADLDNDVSHTAEIIAAVPNAVDGGSNDKGGLYVAEWASGLDTITAGPTVRLRNYLARFYQPAQGSEGSTDAAIGASHYPAFVDGSKAGPYNPTPAAVGDFNKDGFPDVLLGGLGGAANFGAGTNYIDANGFLFETPAQNVGIGAVAERLAVGDLNGDGLSDAVFTGRSGTGSWSVALQDDLGRLGGYPPVATTHDATNDPIGVKIGDINGDGFDDVVLANASWDDATGTISVVPQLPPPHTPRSPLSYERRFYAGRYPEDVAIGDFDSDGQNELVVVNANDNTLMLFDQVKPQPPGVDVVSSGGTTGLSAAASRSARATILWLSDTRPYIQFTEPLLPDLNGIAGYYYVVDQAAGTVPDTSSNYITTGTAVRIGPLTGGTWFLHALSKDLRGNLGTDVSHYQLNIDVTPPTTPTVSDGFDGAWSDADVRNVSFNATDTGAGVKDFVYSVDGTTDTVTGARSVALANLTDGTHVFSVRARDAAAPSNVGAAGTLAMRVDRFPPTCSILSPAENSMVSRNMAVSASATDTAGIKKVEFYLDGALKATQTSPPFTVTISTAGLTQGSHTLLVRAVDMFGHTKDATRLVTVDNVAPRITRVSLSPNPFFPLLRDGYKDNLYIRYTLSKRARVRVTVYNKAKDTIGTRETTHSAGRITYKWPGTVLKSGTVYMLKEGKYYLNLKATDAVGNTATTKLYSFSLRKYVVVVLSGSRVRLVPH